jgi:hypothetical protein
MEDKDQKADARIPGLCLWLNKLLALANETIDNATYCEDDHLAFMALCFLSKQIDHIRSILALIPSRDVILIARSMIEGLCQLLWAARDPDVLPLRWRTFAWVHDWRIMQAKTEAGESIDPERRAAIQEALRVFGDQFLKGRARVGVGPGEPLPADPYHKVWNAGYQIRQICESVGAEDLYRKLYVPFSDWQHWGPGGLGAAIHRQAGRIVYSSLRPTDAATALTVGFQCLLQTVEVVDRHLDLGLAAKITDLRDGYINWHETN